MKGKELRNETHEAKQNLPSLPPFLKLSFSGHFLLHSAQVRATELDQYGINHYLNSMNAIILYRIHWKSRLINPMLGPNPLVGQ